jgi:hypothetical protein
MDRRVEVIPAVSAIQSIEGRWPWRSVFQGVAYAELPPIA